MSTATTAPVHVRELRALGTYVHLQTEGDPDRAQRLAVGLLDDVDLACSRFRSDSDLSRLNRAAGAWTPVSPTLVSALEVAVAVAAATNGLVDPCLGRTLVELGYDTDFGRLRTTGRSPVAVPAVPGAWQQIELDHAGAARIPAGVSLDLGASAKAWASDLIATTLVAELGAPVLVSLGGDLRVAAPPGERRSWLVTITEHPGGLGESVAPETVTLDDGGLATSSTQVRRWHAGAVAQHHLIDPRTGRPTDGPWRTVTATGPSCTAANAASTAALVLGAQAPAWLGEHQVDARLIGTDGRVHHCGAWPTAPTTHPEDRCSRH